MTKTKTTARSVETPGAPKSNPSGLPYGAGSMQMRGRVWWMIYRDIEGRVIQENTKTEDRDAARRLLVVRALETMRAKVAAMEAILNEASSVEAPRQDSGSDGTRERAGRVRSGRVLITSGRKAGKGGSK